MNVDLVDRDIGKIEPMLKQLIDEHGIDAVNEALVPLIGQFNWPTWQRVQNLARRIAARKVQFEKTSKLTKSAISRRKRKI